MSPDFVALAHEHDSVSHFERAVLDTFQQRVGFDAAFLLVTGQEGHLTTSGLGGSALNQLKQRSCDYATELIPVKRAALAARGVAVDTDVLGQQAVRRLHYFRDVAKSVSGRHSLLAYLRKGTQTFGLVMLGRASSGFSAAELARVEVCLPTLSLARSSFAVPWMSAPLQPHATRGLFSRIKLGSTHELMAPIPGGTELTVRDNKNWREMVARSGNAELIWTRVDRRNPSTSGWSYVDLLHLAAVKARARRRALFIGCGGGVSIRQFAEVYPGIDIDIVEKDPQVVDLASRFFGLGEIPKVRIHIEDGDTFVRRSPASCWDIVIVDAFDAKSFDQSFADAEFLANTRRILTPGGALACNLIDILAGGATLSSFVRAAKKVFDHVRLLPVVELNEEFSAFAQRNIVVVASAGG